MNLFVLRRGQCAGTCAKIDKAVLGSTNKKEI